jgi:hypothetical protein
MRVQAIASGGCKGPLRNDPTSSTRPFAVVQSRCEALQPIPLDSHVIVHKSQNVTPSLSNTGVKRMRFALMRLKHVTDAVWVPATELLHYIARLITRVVVHHQNLPFHRFG